MGQLRRCVVLVMTLLCSPHSALAQQAVDVKPAPEAPSMGDAKPPTAADGQPSDLDQAQPSRLDQDDGKVGDRIFGILPNHTTVEGATHIRPVSTKEVFQMAAEDTFDKPVFPFVAFTSWLAGVQGEEKSWGRGPTPYVKRYATTFADDAVATFLTTAVMPSLLHQDPRYFQLGEGSAWHRAWYATTRSFVTRGRSGHRQINVSDISGNFIGAAAANLYHPAEDRVWSDTVARWGTQMMWDILSDDLKEFWPDIRRRVRKP